MVSFNLGCRHMTVQKESFPFFPPPGWKVLVLLPASLPDCCCNRNQPPGRLDADPAAASPRTLSLSNAFPSPCRSAAAIYNFLCFYGSRNMAPMRKSFRCPNPRRAFTARQHDLVKAELFYLPVVSGEKEKSERKEVETEGWEVEKKEPYLSELSNTKKNEHLC